MFGFTPQFELRPSLRHWPITRLLRRLFIVFVPSSVHQDRDRDLASVAGPLFGSLGLLRSVSSGVVQGWSLRRKHRRLTPSPKEEVPVSSSCSMQGLLIAENAG